jgi:hypothetical protein
MNTFPVSGAADPTRVTFGATSIIGYLSAAGATIAEVIKAVEGVHVTTADPLAVAAIVLAGATTFVRGLQAAAKVNGKV